MRVERERACDEAVVRDGTQASSYADHLLEIARGQQGARWASLAAVAMARRSQLEGRLLSILDAGQRRRPSRGTVLALGTVMAGVILMLTAVTPSTGAASPGAGVLTAPPTTTTEVSLGEAVTVPFTDRAAPAVRQTPAPVLPETPPPADAEARERAQDADEQDRRVLELGREREALALLAASQDPARREQVERAEVEVREVERRLLELQEQIDRQVVEEVRAQRDRGAVIAERGLERALELYRRQGALDIEEVFYGVQIAEEIREQLSRELGVPNNSGIWSSQPSPAGPTCGRSFPGVVDRRRCRGT